MILGVLSTLIKDIGKDFDQKKDLDRTGRALRGRGRQQALAWPDVLAAVPRSADGTALATGRYRPGESPVIRAAVAAAMIITAFPLLVIVLVVASPEAPEQATGSAGLSGEDAAGIPADYLTWYAGAAATCPSLPWPVLAGIGMVESDHGQSALPGVHSGANSAGAEGPMQFLPGTFDEFAVNADPGQPLSPYDAADAIYTAARMLCADGARGGSTAGIEQAIFAYNHADWYVTEVLSWASKYAAKYGSGQGTVRTAKPISAQETSL